MKVFTVSLKGVDKRKIGFILCACCVLTGCVLWLAGERKGIATTAITATGRQDAYQVIKMINTTVVEEDENTYEQELREVSETMEEFIPIISNIEMINNMQDLQRYVYSIDQDAYVTPEDLDVTKLLEVDFHTQLQGGGPKILIFHTHSQEAFIDSRPGEEMDTIVGVGDVLCDILASKYRVSVVHDKGRYDVVDGKEDRTNSYQIMEPAIQWLLEKYPSVEIVIDLHRDGVPDDIHFATQLNGKPTAKIMFFNGITKINKGGEAQEIPDLYNPYLRENLALSLQMKLEANKRYPDFTRKIYIKPYRYSLHMLPKSLLIEVGANTNTVEEARNAMEPLAELLVEVLGKGE